MARRNRERELPLMVTVDQAMDILLDMHYKSAPVRRGKSKGNLAKVTKRTNSKRCP